MYNLLEFMWSLVGRGSRTILCSDRLVAVSIVFFVIVMTFSTLCRVQEVDFGRYCSSQALA
jgi:hypothetical protein